MSYDNSKSYLFTGILGGCGCGNSEEIADDVLTLFELIAEASAGMPRHDELWSDKCAAINADKYHELIAHMLDAAGLLEHGSSIGGSWLSPKGQEIYEEIKVYASL